MSRGLPALQTSQHQVFGPPFTPTSANNGLSVDPVTGKIVLGQDLGAVGDPAGLLSDREIPANGFGFHIRNGAFNASGPGLIRSFTDGSNGLSFAFSGEIFGPSLAIVANFRNSTGNGTGAVIQFDVDLNTTQVGAFGNDPAIPVALRNKTFLQAVNLAAPHVALIASQTGRIEFWTVIAGVSTETHRFLLPVSAVLNFPNTLAQTSSDLNVTVTGAQDGDSVSVGVPNAAVNINSSYWGWVSAPNTVTVRFNNYSAAAIDPASATFKISVTRLLP